MKRDDLKAYMSAPKNSPNPPLCERCLADRHREEGRAAGRAEVEEDTDFLKEYAEAAKKDITALTLQLEESQAAHDAEARCWQDEVAALRKHIDEAPRWRVAFHKDTGKPFMLAEPGCDYRSGVFVPRQTVNELGETKWCAIVPVEEPHD